MVSLLLTHNGEFMPDSFDLNTGIFRGSCNFTPNPFFNGYSIRSGMFLNCEEGGRTFPVVSQDVLNLEKVKSWIKDNYPDFEF